MGCDYCFTLMNDEDATRITARGGAWVVCHDCVNALLTDLANEREAEFYPEPEVEDYLTYLDRLCYCDPTNHEC